MTRRQAAAGEICATPMDEYKEHLRRLAVHDDALLEAIAVTCAARVVQCAPKVGLALGYDVDAALERLDP